jgi:hypothetical protein
MSMIARVALLCTVAFCAEAKLALLVGIGDYGAASLRRSAASAPGREWPDLPGPVNDVHAFADLLVSVYGFERGEIVMLTDQRATRAAILQAIERHLVRPANRKDIVFFYFAGHGSQVRNSLSDEPDKLDESIVPADSRAGARDIRDKELRPLFNRILDRGAHLTVILDNCHSGSGARGLGARIRPRGVEPDLRDIADRSHRGPRPENRGALVLTAARDFDLAWDMRDPEGEFHGVFSWALLRAVRDAASGEPAEETFLRAHARVKTETPYQEPVMAGNAAARQRPLLGSRIGRPADRTTVAVSRVRKDGSVLLQGGWAHGLSVGTELRVAGDVRLVVTHVRGPGESEARAMTGSRAIRTGALAEVVRPIAPPRLRISGLQSPPSPYRLRIRDARTRQIVERVVGKRHYELVARATNAAISEHRYLYAFAIDSAGRSVLLFPRSGSVENRFAPATEIVLGRFEGAAPYGVDTYVLLTSDAPLPNPWILQWNDVRGPPIHANWSIDSISVESIPPPRSKVAAAVSLP